MCKEIPSNNHVMGVEFDYEQRKVIDPAAINLNIKRKVLSDRGSLGAIKSLRNNGLGKFLRREPESATKIRCETSTKENVTTCSGVT
jgi:hypothetical protein